MNIADTIRQSREARGLTQEDLAERLEVSRQAVSKWGGGGLCAHAGESENAGGDFAGHL